MLITPLSQVEKALRDTVTIKAAGEWLTRLAALHGIPYAKGISEDAWREGLRVAALGPRGVPGTTWEWLRAVLGDYTTELAVEVNIAARPQRVQAQSGTPFTQAHIGTFMRLQIEGEDTWTTYFIDRPDDVSVLGLGAWVELAAVGTPQWAAADFSGLNGLTNATAQLLPFTLDEPSPGPDDPAPLSPGLRNWLVIIRLLATTALTTPPTYLQPGTGARPVGEPYGGHLQLDEFHTGDQTQGPFPIYLTGTSLGGLTTALDLLLVSGAHAEWKEPL